MNTLKMNYSMGMLLNKNDFKAFSNGINTKYVFIR